MKACTCGDHWGEDDRCPLHGDIRRALADERYTCRYGHADCAKSTGGQCYHDSWESRQKDAGTWAG